MTMMQGGSEDRVEKMIELSERLTELVAQDAQAFEQRRPLDVARNLEESSRLANLYRHEAARLRAAPHLIEQAPIQVRARLVRATEAFEAVLARQGRALEAARTVTEGLVRAIAEEVASQRAGAGSYGPGASAPDAAGSATAITLNRRA